MSKRQILMILGVWIMTLPFLGFPRSWDTVLQILTGIIVIGIAYSMRQKVKPVSPQNVPFVEHRSDVKVGDDLTFTSPGSPDKK